ncbi:MAG: rhomboid family intramembrane serine protease [Haloarculaceae archaeon]
MASLDLILKATMVVAAVASGATLWWLSRPVGPTVRRVRSRLLLGIPWGTLVTVALVLAVYLFLQRGIVDRYSPLHLPFTSWSYGYPLGMVTAPFAHKSFGHLVGNLLGTVVLAPVAEYAWSHFPTERGESSFSSWRTNPYLRAFVLFPLGVVVVALTTSYLHWGPVIGFSGVVFAFAGFALVRFPVATVLALVAQNLVGLAYQSLRQPVVPGEAQVTFSRPSWAGIAVLGHFLGLLLGALAGALLFRRRTGLPSAPRLFAGAVLVATLTDLWAIWWYTGPASFVLYRAAGVAIVLIAGAAVALVVRAGDRELIGGVDRRTAATALFVLPLLTVAFVAVPVNYVEVSPDAVPGGEGHVTVRGYTVTYAEDVPNRRISVVDVSLFNASTNVTASGLIVVNPHREVWTQVAPPGELAAERFEVVRVGGVGWERRVLAVRTGWSAAGNGSVFAVWLRAEGRSFVRSYTSDPATADPVVAGRNVTVVPRQVVDGPNTTVNYGLRVWAGNETLGVAAMPVSNQTTSAGGVTFRRRGKQVVAVRNGTRVVVATRESGI